MAVGDSVDTAFGNNIDVDTIVVMGSFLTLSWVLNCIAKIGAYVYRLLQDKVWTCMAVSVICSIVCGVLTIVFAEPIIHLFTLTQLQYGLLKSVVIVYSSSLVIYGVGFILDMYCLMKGRMKWLVIADIVYYVFLIGLDIVVMLLHMNCVWLIAGTLFSYLLFDIVLLFKSGILQEKHTVKVRDCFMVFKHGCNFMMSKLSIRVAIIFMRSIVSKMGTELYALYTVANAVEEFNENYVAAWENYLTVKIKQFKETDRYKNTVQYVRKYGKFMLSLFCCSIPLTTLLLKGSLPYFAVFLSACVVSLGNVGGMFERAYYAYLSACEKSVILRWDGVIGASVRILLCTVVYLMGGNLIGYLICYPIDTLCRAIFMFTMSKMVSRSIQKA